ncbi:hypothetical protein MKW92_006136 [Papaver armeniacum]|nr:hypothetical protein MKW92_006136 [Papaver armeniacum]
MDIMSDDKQSLQNEKIKEEDEEIKTWEELGLDPRLISALNKNGIDKPTPIQISGISLILEGKDVVAQAKTGSGKTYAYLLPLLQKLFSDTGVYEEVLSLIVACKVQLKVVQVTRSMSGKDLRAALAEPLDILVSTPSCISTCLQSHALKKKLNPGIPSASSADLLLSHGYEDDLKALTPHIPRRCQCLLMYATSSADVEKLKKLVLHSPVILTLPEVGNVKDEMIPENIQQFWISCSNRDKQLHMLSLLKSELVQKKILIFVNTIDMGFRLKFFLEQFGMKSAFLIAELLQNSRQHIIEEFNAGLFDYLIATDDSQTKEKAKANDDTQVTSKKSRRHPRPKLDSEFGVVRGIDLKNVYTYATLVINFEMPLNAAGYVHRIAFTGSANNTGASVSLVSEDEMDVFEEIKTTLDENKVGSNVIAPFHLLSKDSVEFLRYGAEEILEQFNTFNMIKGTTCIGLKYNGEIMMTADSYGLMMKKIEMLGGEKRRTDWDEDKTSFFRLGSPAFKHYFSLSNTTWVEREDYVVADDNCQKIFVLRMPFPIILTVCGFVYVFYKALDDLKKMDTPATFYACVQRIHDFLTDFKPEDSDHEGRKLEDITCRIMIGGFEETSNVNQRVLKLYEVGKGKIDLVEERFRCLGQGDYLDNKILRKQFGKDIAKEDAVRHLFESMEAASLARMSGGIITIVSLFEHGDQKTELQEKIGL